MKKTQMGYYGCPDRIKFVTYSATAQNWFIDAMSVEKLRLQIDAAMRTLVPKGKISEVTVRPLKNPLKDLKDATFYLSEHNNYHLGDGSQLSCEELLLLNKGDYRYYQDERYFFTIKKASQDKNTYFLFVNKKRPHDEEARAQQD